MKSKLPDGRKARINHAVQHETYRNVLIVAAETGRTVSATVDWLLRRGIAAYSKDTQPDGS